MSPYEGEIVVGYARHFSREESEVWPSLKAALVFIEGLEDNGDGYALTLQTPDGRLLYEREVDSGPSLGWHIRAVDAPPLPVDGPVQPWTKPKPKPPMVIPGECPGCGARTVRSEVEPIEVLVGANVHMRPGPMRGTCENGHTYGPEVLAGRR